MIPEKHDRSLYSLEPNISLGPFVFDDEISNYLETYSLETDGEADDITGWVSYQCVHPRLDISVEDGKIISVSGNKLIFIDTVPENLIGLDFDYFLDQSSLKYVGTPDSIYMPNVDDVQIVYEFETIGAQIWVYNGEIITVICSDES